MLNFLRVWCTQDCSFCPNKTKRSKWYHPPIWNSRQWVQTLVAIWCTRAQCVHTGHYYTGKRKSPCLLTLLQNSLLDSLTFFFFGSLSVLPPQLQLYGLQKWRPKGEKAKVHTSILFVLPNLNALPCNFFLNSLLFNTLDSQNECGNKRYFELLKVNAHSSVFP